MDFVEEMSERDCEELLGFFKSENPGRWGSSEAFCFVFCALEKLMADTGV